MRSTPQKITKHQPIENVWLSSSVPRGYWDITSNRRKYFDWLAVQLNYSGMEDWYKLTNKMVHQNHGSGLLLRYKDSHISALVDLYPEHYFFPWKFSSVRNGYWDDRANRK